MLLYILHIIYVLYIGIYRYSYIYIYIGSTEHKLFSGRILSSEDVENPHKVVGKKVTHSCQ